MVGRGAWLAGVGLLGYVLACNVTTGPFTCQENDDCVLQGVPGVCDGEGRCSYPDDACSSGYSYPAATPGVGGDCAPDPGNADASTGGAPVESSSGAAETTASVGDEGTSEDGTTAQLDSAGSDESTSDSGDAASSSGGESTSTTTGGSSSGGPACPDTVGDSPAQAEALGGCFMKAGMGTIVDEEDVDWWQLGAEDGTCEDGEVEAFVKGEAALEVCLYAVCFGGNSASIQCLQGESEMIDGFDACCGEGGVVADLNCGVAGATSPYVRVRGEDVQCSAYALVAGVVD